MMEAIRVLLFPLPMKIKGYTVLMEDTYTIVINSNLDELARWNAYEHEMRHIGRDDLRKDDSAGAIELGM